MSYFRLKLPPVVLTESQVSYLSLRNVLKNKKDYKESIHLDTHPLSN